MNTTTRQEIEIRDIPPLSPGETSLLDAHSLLNVLNVLHGELYVLGCTLADDGDLLRPALESCARFQASLTDPAACLREAARLPDWRDEVEAHVRLALAAYPQRAILPEVGESVENIRSVFAIFGLRAQELLARAQAPLAWAEFPIVALRQDFVAVFAAIERNSHGRYRILYNLAQQGPSDYYVDFVIESTNHRTVSMPPVFKDVMRDLMANARKYTPLGGAISAGLDETATSLRFAVMDSGCGIPPQEIATVVHYGRRGSNVVHLRTMGGGFGLTKAFLVTKRFGGRFWISSELGAGTRIRLEIPRPGMSPAGG